MKHISLILLISALLPAVLPANADVLLLEAIERTPVNRTGGVLRPRSGQEMDRVRTRFGEPIRELPLIGDPPITRWVYDRYTVYFEYDKVITTVVHR